ncbi:MAG: hypothetical protein Q9184_004635 [Pyrenodesmia sp. 2 TL-2023]
MPQVVLDTTLKELYDRDSSCGPHGQIALVQGFPSSEFARTSRIPRNAKYLYHDNTFTATPLDISSAERAELQRVQAVKFLSLIQQRDAFVAGNMPVILFEPQDSRKETARTEKEVGKTLKILVAEQRPSTIFVSSPKEIAMEANGIDLLAAKMDWDELEGFPSAIDLDTHYFLNSKAALCTSGLPRYVSHQAEAVRYTSIRCLLCEVWLSRNKVADVEGQSVPSPS